MGLQRKTVSLFYCDGDIHARLRDQDSRTVFRGGEQALAEWTGSAVQNVSLLSVNKSGSVNGVGHQGRWERFDYTAYGHCSSLSAGRSLLGFNGEYYDNLIQGYMLGNGYRFFNRMRFNSPDSFAPFKVLNAYGYCDGDPINYTDSSGHLGESLKPLLKPAGYKESKKFMREMDDLASSLKAKIDNLDYSPGMGKRKASKLKKHFTHFLQSTEDSTNSHMSRLAQLKLNSPQGYWRASEKVDFPSVLGRLGQAFKFFGTAANFVFYQMQLPGPPRPKLSRSQSYKGALTGGETFNGALRSTRSLDRLNLTAEAFTIRAE
ncbi:MULTISPECIES: RHS repeat-associated core domain-containing protein [Pseudomonas]|uniref:RHS repeat-associated core domain-containing protein n=1 Tax=Pseudomonas TaxID=286 RepID=UPI000A1F8B2D|nr:MULTISPECIES: RHS repeat-associated core domain-containing protein [Pseudomonas]